MGQPLLRVSSLFSSQLALAGVLVTWQHSLEKPKQAGPFKAFAKSYDTFPSARVPPEGMQSLRAKVKAMGRAVTGALFVLHR